MLQLLERAVEGPFHALGQVAIGKAGHHAADLGDAGVDAGHQLVDAGRETVEVRVLIILGDAAIEIAPHGAGDHLGDAGLQVCALGLKGCFLCVELAHLERILLEDLDGLGHLADLVPAAGKGNVHLEPAFRKCLHGSRQASDRATELGRTDIGGGTRARC